jgi:hypothetical protein
MRSILLLIIFLLSVTFISGQEITFPSDTILESDGQYFMPYSPGVKEKTTKIAPEVARMKPSQVSLLKRKLAECSDLLLTDSAFINPTGLKIRISEEIYPIDGINDLVKWIPSSVEVDLYTTLAKDSLPFWDSTPDAWLTVNFNNPRKLVGNPVINNIFIEPMLTGINEPWEEYDRISAPNRITVARKNSLPWFEPVSREDFILTLITFFQVAIEKAEKKAVQPRQALSASNASPRETERQKYAAEMEKIRKIDPALADKLMQAYLSAEESVDPGDQLTKQGTPMDNNIMLNTWREAVRKLKAEMNAMSPVELKSQAWWSDTEDSNVSGLTPAGYSGARPLIRLNKNLIDKNKPGSAIQLIVVEWSVIPGTDFTDISGFNLAYSKISLLGNNQKLWQHLFDLLEP